MLILSSNVDSKDNEEFFNALGCLILVVIGWLTWIDWYKGTIKIAYPAAQIKERRLLRLTPIINALVIFSVVEIFPNATAIQSAEKDFDVIINFAWLGVSVVLMDCFNLSMREDVLERNNSAATYAMLGFLWAITCCLVGLDLGNLDHWFINLLLAMGGLCIAWLILEKLSNCSEDITIDRDIAAGVRLTGFLIACGIIFGGAIAGEKSFTTLAKDLLYAFGPVLMLVFVAFNVNRKFKPTPNRPVLPVVNCGWVPALTYTLFAIFSVVIAKR